MSDAIVTLEDTAAHLPELIERIRSNQEPTVIIKSGQPMVRIVLIPRAADNLVAFLTQWRTDYPEPDDQFAEAIEESRRGLQPPAIRSRDVKHQ